MTKLLEGPGEYRVHSGGLKWSGIATSFDDALDKALAQYSGDSLGELIRIDAPTAKPSPKRSHVAYYQNTVFALKKRGLWV